MVGVVGGIIAFLQALSPLFIFFSIIGGYALGATAVNQTLGYRQRRQQRLNATPKRKLERIEHDGVLWEHIGRHYAFSNELFAEGPFCPKDYCPLSLRYGRHRGGHEEVRADNHADQEISSSDFNAILFCPQCKERYTLGAKEEGKTIKQSRQEVESLFEGRHRRETSV